MTNSGQKDASRKVATPWLLLSGFSDEAVASKQLTEQMAICSALGLSHFAIRFLDVGTGLRNVVQLTPSELATARQVLDDYGMRVSTIGSPLGKVRLSPEEDGTSTPYVPLEAYLAEQVPRVCELARSFGTRWIRAFTFYPPRGADPDLYLEQAVEAVGRMAEVCHDHDCVLGLEVEANLTGNTGVRLAELHRRLGDPRVVLVFDAGNLVMQGFTEDEVFAEYQAMKPYLGWLHVKDYRGSGGSKRPGGYVDESQVRDFVPAGSGSGAYRRVFADLAESLPDTRVRLSSDVTEPFLVELEPHLRGGGQFGGFSGPDGFGVALRGLCQLLTDLGLRYALRDWETMQQAN